MCAMKELAKLLSLGDLITEPRIMFSKPIPRASAIEKREEPRRRSKYVPSLFKLA